VYKEQFSPCQDAGKYYTVSITAFPILSFTALCKDIANVHGLRHWAHSVEAYWLPSTAEPRAAKLYEAPKVAMQFFSPE
jgi:hypothetical protein